MDQWTLIGRAKLSDALLAQWPTYLAYVISFVTVLIMRTNRHKMFRNIRRTDHSFMLLNGLLRMWVTLVPFPTAMLAECFDHPYARVAAAVYSGTFVMIAVTFTALWRYASAGNWLLAAGTIQGRRGDHKAVPLWTVDVRPALGACMLLAAFFALPSSANQ